ncbi:MAG: hypothetical protein HOL01_09190 [Planctomycetaceae bacterium]|jgi:hypothetical protein|nr:hypothetical protein [Planctomycetaceae bacterium]MBT6483480.1 hypothetical protein [Planctomycetaceae bacterium]MBT6494709.1 hypothetical protein [Planctomycetaceae bacterium]
MQKVDEARLETDLQYRFEYLSEFIGFDESDVAVIHASAGYLAPHIPGIVERTYEKLLSYDATARHFVPRQHGHEGGVPAGLEDLSANHEQIRFRMEHLSRYLMQLVGHAYNEKMVTYLDMVGKMHTPKAGNKAIDVPLVQMNALMGLMSDLLAETILGLDLDDETRFRTLRAFQKLLWLQNDLANRHYAADAGQ